MSDEKKQLQVIAEMFSSGSDLGVNLVFLDTGEIRQKRKSKEWFFKRIFQSEIKRWKKRNEELRLADFVFYSDSDNKEDKLKTEDIPVERKEIHHSSSGRSEVEASQRVMLVHKKYPIILERVPFEANEAIIRYNIFDPQSIDKRVVITDDSVFEERVYNVIGCGFEKETVDES